MQLFMGWNYGKNQTGENNRFLNNLNVQNYMINKELKFYEKYD